MKDKNSGKSNKMQVQKLPTGIEGFDDVCRGGLPVSRSTLVSGTSGTGKTVFSLQYLHSNCCFCYGLMQCDFLITILLIKVK